jgi:hypothetical protein
MENGELPLFLLLFLLIQEAIARIQENKRNDDLLKQLEELVREVDKLKAG